MLRSDRCRRASKLSGQAFEFIDMDDVQSIGSSSPRRGSYGHDHLANLTSMSVVSSFSTQRSSRLRLSDSTLRLYV